MNQDRSDNWYKANNCTHAHCPDECEHPQPILHNGKLYCGRCLIMFKEWVEMIPCTPEVCKE